MEVGSVTVDYSEFDDIERNGPYVASKKAREEIARLMRKYGLGFTHNPGGGEFFGDRFRCQITTYDDVSDLNDLRAAIAKWKAP